MLKLRFMFAHAIAGHSVDSKFTHAKYKNDVTTYWKYNANHFSRPPKCDIYHDLCSMSDV